MRILRNYTLPPLPSYKCCPLKGDRLLVTTWAIVPLVKHLSVTLAVSPEKCFWKTQEVEFLGYVIGKDGIKMSNEKVEVVLSWKTPSSLTEVQSFLGFANFY